jgi:hypothetical protein
VRIGYDIDDTVAGTMSGILSFFNNRYGFEHTVESVVAMQESGIYNYKEDILSQLYNMAPEEVDDIFVKESHLILPYVEPLGPAWVNIRNQATMGCEIYYITARHEKYSQHSLDWLAAGQFPKSELICTRDKGSVAKKLNLAYFYEDNLHNISELRKEGVNCFIVDALCNHTVNFPKVPRMYWNKKITDARSKHSMKIH